MQSAEKPKNKRSGRGRSLGGREGEQKRVGFSLFHEWRSQCSDSELVDYQVFCRFLLLTPARSTLFSAAKLRRVVYSWAGGRRTAHQTSPKFPNSKSEPIRPKMRALVVGVGQQQSRPPHFSRKAHTCSSHGTNVR